MHMHMHARTRARTQLRNGDVVWRNGELMRVAQFQWTHGKARASGGSVALDLIHLKNGALPVLASTPCSPPSSRGVLDTSPVA